MGRIEKPTGHRIPVVRTIRVRVDWVQFPVPRLIVSHSHMKILIEALSENPISLLRRAGYVFQREEQPARNATHSVAGGGEMSFIRTLASAGYPRFHCYAKLNKLALTISLHLDQKKHTYGETTRHHGEYANEGPVKEEVTRLLSLFGEKAKII